MPFIKDKAMPTSCYIHIPFCKNICTYCDFCKVYYNKDLVLKYLDSLKKEIVYYYRQEPLETLYIGGGTPSCLQTPELLKLFEIIKLLNIKPNYEFTFECNIEDINESLLKLLKNNNVNRLSIGVQSFNNNILKKLGRTYQKEIINSKIALAKKYFENINIDLIYAVQGQSMQNLKQDLNNFLNLEIPHLSIYSLILEDNTILKIKGYTPIEEDLDRAMYDLIVKVLKKHNYNHYEISNFCKKGFLSKHNMTYWNNERYYGFGLGASGYLNNFRYTNTRSITNYLKNHYKKEFEFLTPQKSQENFIILGLRKIAGVSSQEFYKRYNKNIKDVFDTSKLEYQNGNYYIKEDDLYVSNNILKDFIN